MTRQIDDHDIERSEAYELQNRDVHQQVRKVFTGPTRPAAQPKKPARFVETEKQSRQMGITFGLFVFVMGILWDTTTTFGLIRAIFAVAVVVVVMVMELREKDKTFFAAAIVTAAAGFVAVHAFSDFLKHLLPTC